MNRLFVILLVISVLVVALLLGVMTRQRSQPTYVPAVGAEPQQQEPIPRYKGK